MTRSNYLEEQIETEMLNEVRYSLTQERRNNNNLKIAFVISDSFKMKNDSTIALKKDTEGITLISVQKKATLTETNIKRVIQYGIMHALNLKLKSEILNLSGPGKDYMHIHDLKVNYRLKIRDYINLYGREELLENSLTRIEII